MSLDIDLKKEHKVVCQGIFQFNEEDYRSFTTRKNNDDTMASCNIHSRYCIHGVSNVVKCVIYIKYFKPIQINKSDCFSKNFIDFYFKLFVDTIND